ncbi:MAG: organoarsenical effux MFS transporter ArsJ [Polyangiales bacterium]
MSAIRNYVLVTLAYWAFTLTDGALRMLVLLHFHALGYTPVELAFLFLFYEFFGVVTNLVGGWVAALLGLKVTLTGGLALQVFALVMLAYAQPTWSVAMSVAYVMASQALSGIAKDLTKMSAKTSVKVLVPKEHGDRDRGDRALFKWVALLTGSKNALKGVGFFLGGALLTTLGYRGALFGMAGAIAIVFVGTVASLPGEMGRVKSKAKFKGLLSKSREINVLSAARFLLFAGRDVWFVVGVPVFLSSALGWGFTKVGSFLALWVIGYGAIQSLAPALIRRWTHGEVPRGTTARWLALLLAIVSALVALGVHFVRAPMLVVVGGLALFGVVFAINSSVHSFLILAYSAGDKVALNVGFYYMANAGGRLVGSLLSGVLFQLGGVAACLWGAVAFGLATWGVSMALPSGQPEQPLPVLWDDAAGGD